METRTVVGLGVLIALALCGGAFAEGNSITLDGLTLGKTVYGKEWKIDELRNRVVLVEMWGIRCPPCVASLPKLSKWQEKYEQQGLVIIGIHRQRASNDALREFVKKKNVKFTIVATGRLEGDRAGGIPRCYLFDSTGKCVFSGHPSDVLTPLKEALAKAPFAALGDRELVKLKSIGNALKKGMPPVKALKKAEGLLESADEQTADEAAYIVESLTKWGEKRVERAQAGKDSEPVTCVAELKSVVKGFAGTDIASKASETLALLKKDDAFQAELTLARIKLLEGELRPLLHSTSKDTTSPAFRTKNYALLKKIYGGVRMMQKKYPDSVPTKKAEALAKKYGLIK